MFSCQRRFLSCLLQTRDQVRKKEKHTTLKQPTMTSVDCTQTTSQEDMEMPLLCSTGTRKNYPRKMVLMNAAHVKGRPNSGFHTGYGHEV